jgi:hypothetical protein
MRDHSRTETSPNQFLSSMKIRVILDSDLNPQGLLRYIPTVRAQTQPFLAASVSVSARRLLPLLFCRGTPEEGAHSCCLRAEYSPLVTQVLWLQRVPLPIVPHLNEVAHFSTSIAFNSSRHRNSRLSTRFLITKNPGSPFSQE